MLKPEDIVVDIANYPTRGMLLGIPVGVKITHKPTGISVVEDSERSQHRNREVALQKLEKMVAEAKPAPMSDDNRKVAYAAADKLRKLGYRWDDGIGDWVGAAAPAPQVQDAMQPEMLPVFPGGEPWPHYPHLQVGQRVRTHTDEEGEIVALRNSTKKYQVLIRSGYGGQYGSWEVTPIAAPQPPAAAQEPNHWIVPEYGFLFPTEEAATRYLSNIGSKSKPTACYTSSQPAVTAGAVDALPDEKTCVDYVLRYGGRCRDCADENGICPGSGLPCGGQRKAVTHVVQALRYGLQHGYLRAAQREVKP